MTAFQNEREKVFGMRKLSADEYSSAGRYVEDTGCGTVYPLSMAEGVQQGDIFADGGSVLFWHCCGFAFLFGDRGGQFLDSVYDGSLGGESELPRRFILFVTDERTKEQLLCKEGLTVGKRCFFEYRGNSAPAVRQLPAGLRLCEFGGELFDKLNGRVTPRFSWSSAEEFSEHGKGCCILDGDTAAAWAFTAAVSRDEIDIGVETAVGYRGMGLATAAAAAMIRYCLAQRKRPVWACDVNNIGSQRLAAKLGFEKTAECLTFRRQPADLSG